MCLMHPVADFDCTNKYRGTCFKVIHLDPMPGTVGECYQRLVELGWVVVPHTGTFTYCSEDCYRSAGWGAYGDSLRL
jgi:hypothetical protein